MSRLLSPDHKCVEVDTNRRRYRGTVLEVTNPRDERDLRAAGYTVGDVAGEPSKASGRLCTACGFKGWFTTCGRCGGICERAD